MQGPVRQTGQLGQDQAQRNTSFFQLPSGLPQLVEQMLRGLPTHLQKAQHCQRRAFQEFFSGDLSTLLVPQGESRQGAAFQQILHISFPEGKGKLLGPSFPQEKGLPSCQLIAAGHAADSPQPVLTRSEGKLPVLPRLHISSGQDLEPFRPPAGQGIVLLRQTGLTLGCGQRQLPGELLPPQRRKTLTIPHLGNTVHQLGRDPQSTAGGAVQQNPSLLSSCSHMEHPLRGTPQSRVAVFI